jgi:hypothetical protein
MQARYDTVYAQCWLPKAIGFRRRLPIIEVFHGARRRRHPRYESLLNGDQSFLARRWQLAASKI